MTQANLGTAEFWPFGNQIELHSQPSAFQLDIPDEQDYENNVRNNSGYVDHLQTI